MANPIPPTIASGLASVTKTVTAAQLIAGLEVNIVPGTPGKITCFFGAQVQFGPGATIYPAGPNPHFFISSQTDSALAYSGSWFPPNPIPVGGIESQASGFVGGPNAAGENITGKGISIFPTGFTAPGDIPATITVFYQVI